LAGPNGDLVQEDTINSFSQSIEGDVVLAGIYRSSRAPVWGVFLSFKFFGGWYRSRRNADALYTLIFFSNGRLVSVPYFRFFVQDVWWCIYLRIGGWRSKGWIRNL